MVKHSTTITSVSQALGLTVALTCSWEAMNGFGSKLPR